MKAFLIYSAVIRALSALVTLNTKPFSPRAPHGSARVLMLCLVVDLAVAAWAVSLLWELP